MIILPKLCDCGGNTRKQWFVYYSIHNLRTGKMDRIRHYEGFTGLKATQKYELAEKLIEEYTIKLKSGWTPINDATEVIYEDNLDFKTLAEMYGARRAGNRTLRPILSKYMDHKKSEIAPGSFSTYCSALRIFTIWTEKKGMQELDIIAYNKELLYQFFEYLINTRQLSGKSVTKYKALLLHFFNYCLDRKLIRKNPVVNIPRCNRVNDQTPRPILKADIAEFRKELVKDPELLLAIQFEFYCALRPGHEIREMQIKNIDLVSGIIRVTRSLAKNRTERIVTIPYQFLIELRRIFAEWQRAGINLDREFYLLGVNGIPGPVYISKNHLTRKFNIIRKRLCMPVEYKLYSWKHTAAVMVDECLIPFKDLSRHYGHSSISITDEYLKNKKPGLSNKIRDNYPDLWEKQVEICLTSKDISIEIFSN
jgi:integrase